MAGLVRSVYDLDVFRLAYGLSLEVHRFSKLMNKTEQYGGMADQIRRASKSICANLAEGFGKNSSAAEFRRFVFIALGSCNEVILWLHYARDLHEITPDTFTRFEKDYGQVARMLQGLARARSA